MDKSNEILFKEIDLIQEIVKRLASNSFLIKGWAVTQSKFASSCQGARGPESNTGVCACLSVGRQAAIRVRMGE